MASQLCREISTFASLSIDSQLQGDGPCDRIPDANSKMKNNEGETLANCDCGRLNNNLSISGLSVLWVAFC